MAIITIKYCLVTNEEYTVKYDDVNHTVNDENIPTSAISCSNPAVSGDVIHVQVVTNGRYFVKAKPSATRYWAEVVFEPSAPACNANIATVTVTPESLPGNSDAKITVTSVPSSGLEYRLDEDLS